MLYIDNFPSNLFPLLLSDSLSLSAAWFLTRSTTHILIRYWTNSWSESSVTDFKTDWALSLLNASSKSYRMIGPMALGNGHFSSWWKGTSNGGTQGIFSYRANQKSALKSTLRREDVYFQLDLAIENRERERESSCYWIRLAGVCLTVDSWALTLKSIADQPRPHGYLMWNTNFPNPVSLLYQNLHLNPTPTP